MKVISLLPCKSINLISCSEDAFPMVCVSDKDLINVGWSPVMLWLVIIFQGTNVGWPVWYDNYGFGFSPEHFWQYPSHKYKMSKHVEVHLPPYKRKGILAYASGSGCHKTKFGKCLLVLRANRSKYAVPSVFMTFLKAAGLTCYSTASSNSLEYKSASTLLKAALVPV